MSRVSSFVAAVQTELDDSSVAFVIGKKNEGKHGQRRRVHWYYGLGGEIEQNQRKGGTLTDDDATRTVSVWQRSEIIRVRAFAENEDTLEALFENLITAIDRAAGVNAVDWQGYDWHEEEIAQRIPMIQLEFRLALPVADEISTLVTITAVENTVEFEDE